MPLVTDALIAGETARRIASELDAALLPVLPYGTSLEHAGFRGSFTLRPETLMQTIRDLADEAEKQGFRYMVVVNGHGGNFCLVPVIRDINRCDRPLKILLVPIGGFRPAAAPGASDERAPREMDIHSGESETSVMLALFPELVREERPDRPADTSDHPFVQPDLTTFGMGVMNPKGVIGRASLATAEKGRAMHEAAVENMLAYIRDRIRRLEADSRYSGTVRWRE
jgi:creatinine amidohydrolase